MLKQRVITALVLVGILIAVLAFAPGWGFSAITLVLIVAAAWEWARLVLPAETENLNGKSLGYATLAFTVCVAVWVLELDFAFEWWAISVLWLLLAIYVLMGGQAAWLKLPLWLRLVLGQLVLVSTWVGLGFLRLGSVNLLLSSMALVWFADIGAYFAGRAFGGKWIERKLAPSISPNKTWEGVLGGLIAMLVGSAIWLQLEAYFGWQPSFMRMVIRQDGAGVLMVACMAILAFSIFGDLFESLLKRSAGVKDSSGLLPGHGGVLDRVDALLPTMPLVVWIIGMQR